MAHASQVMPALIQPAPAEDNQPDKSEDQAEGND
jgi:hypothetical protein